MLTQATQDYNTMLNNHLQDQECHLEFDSQKTEKEVRNGTIEPNPEVQSQKTIKTISEQDQPGSGHVYSERGLDSLGGSKEVYRPENR